jgi:hypothetical protein
MDLEFPSRRDLWIVIVIWFSIAMLLVGARVMLGAPGHLIVRIGIAALMLAMGGFSLWVTYGTGYTVTAKELHVRSGPFRYRVPLADIVSITPSNNPLSSPAVSLDRLRIAYRDASGRERTLLVSPEDKAGFLAAIATRCPSLHPSGDRLVPRA